MKIRHSTVWIRDVTSSFSDNFQTVLLMAAPFHLLPLIIFLLLPFKMTGSASLIWKAVFLLLSHRLCVIASPSRPALWTHHLSPSHFSLVTSVFVNSHVYSIIPPLSAVFPLLLTIARLSARLEYKYSRLVMSANKECEMPGADSCAVMEGENEGDMEDEVVYTKPSLLGKLKAIASKVRVTAWLNFYRMKIQCGN